MRHDRFDEPVAILVGRGLLRCEVEDFLSEQGFGIVAVANGTAGIHELERKTARFGAVVRTSASELA